MSDAETDRLGSELLAACEREAAAKERAADMERRAEAAEAAWAALRAQVADQQQRAEAATSHIRDLRRLLRDAEVRHSEQQDRAKQAEARLAAVVRACDEEKSRLEGRWFVLVHEVRAAATGTEPAPEVD